MDPAKQPFANSLSNRADGTPLQLAVRELRGFLARSRFWLILGGASFTLALAGPFYTLERLSFPSRLLYWSATAVFSGILMTFLSLLGRQVTLLRNTHWLPTSVAVGGIGVLPIMAVVYVANVLSGVEVGGHAYWRLFPYVSVPVIVITVVVNALRSDAEDAPAAPAPATYPTPQAATLDKRAAAPATGTPDESLKAVVAAPKAELALAPSAPSLLLSKLPHTLGTEIVALQARDHYVDVTTTRGSAMILMRLSDAARDLEGFDGLRVHRSWWVSLPHIERLEKGTSGPELRLVTGQIVPVSRGQRAAVRAALAERGEG